MTHPHPQPRAWTGGTSPRPWSEVAGTPEGELVIALHLEQTGIWRSYWGDVPGADVKSTFWNRARHDAHATYRAEKT